MHDQSTLFGPTAHNGADTSREAANTESEATDER